MRKKALKLFSILLPLIFINTMMVVGVERFPFVRQIEKRIYKAGGHSVELTEQEKKALISSFSLELKKFFGSPDLSPEIRAYWGKKFGFLNRNDVRFVRFSRDGRRYARVFLNGTGTVVMHDAALKDRRLEQEMFPPEEPAEGGRLKPGMKGTYDGLSYLAPSGQLSLIVKGKAKFETIDENSTGQDRITFQDFDGNSYIISVQPKKLNDPKSFLNELAKQRKQSNPNVSTGNLATGEPMFLESSLIKSSGSKVRGKVNIIFFRNGLSHDLTLETKEVNSEDQAGEIVREGTEGILAAIGIVKYE